MNLDDIYQNYHIFARFITNASVDLPEYIDYELLFTQRKSLEEILNLESFMRLRQEKPKKNLKKQNKKKLNMLNTTLKRLVLTVRLF